VADDDREGLERLSRYLLRPPLEKERLEQREDGKLVLHLRKAWSDGSVFTVYSGASGLGRPRF
jgi:hypothetical protein